MAGLFGEMSGPAPELASLIFQSIAVDHRFEFHANGVGDRDDGASLEYESRQHRAELMHFERVITFHQHIPAPITDADDKRVDLEIGWRFPWAEDLQDSLLCIFVLGEVGKHFPGSKDGYAVRRLEVSSKVVIGSLAYLDQVAIGGVQVVKVESQKPSGQCGG